MSQRILDIHRASGDANLGQTLLRLAALAQARQQLAGIRTDHSTSSQTEIGAKGLGPEAAIRPERIKVVPAADRLHTEVDR